MTVRNTVHTITVQASAADVYELISDVTNWPQLFPPTVHAVRVDGTGTQERIRIWARANEGAKTWTSRRSLYPQTRSITFEQEIPAWPVASMGGSWGIIELGEGRCEIRLTHSYQAVDDLPEHLEWIDRAVERNSTTELAALKQNVELVTAGQERGLLSFADTVHVAGDPQDVYDFLNAADLWPERLPHVARARLTETTPGLQELEMDTRTKDGATHTTVSIRVCVPNERIVYKQITLPALMTLHTGAWDITPVAGGGVSVTSHHDVLINEANIGAVLGPQATVADARRYVQQALSANSKATLLLAKQHAESMAGVTP